MYRYTTLIKLFWPDTEPIVCTSLSAQCILYLMVCYPTIFSVSWTLFRTFSCWPVQISGAVQHGGSSGARISLVSSFVRLIFTQSSTEWCVDLSVLTSLKLNSVTLSRTQLCSSIILLFFKDFYTCVHVNIVNQFVDCEYSTREHAKLVVGFFYRDSYRSVINLSANLTPPWQLF